MTKPQHAKILAKLSEYGWDVPDAVRPMTHDEFIDHAMIHFINMQKKDALVRENWAAIKHLVKVVYGPGFEKAWEEYRKEFER